MRCNTARQAIFELGLGLTAADRDSPLSRHLSECDGCAAAAREERRIVEELAHLGGDYPDSIDVAPRVMQRIAQLDNVVRHEVSHRQLAWATAAAILTALVATVVFVDSLPPTSQLVAAVQGVTSTAGSLMRGLGATLLAFASTAGKLIAVAIESFSAIGSSLRVAQPVVSSLFGLAYLMMAMTIAVVVYRDWTGRPLLGAGKEF